MLILFPFESQIDSCFDFIQVFILYFYCSLFLLLIRFWDLVQVVRIHRGPISHKHVRAEGVLKLVCWRHDSRTIRHRAYELTRHSFCHIWILINVICLCQPDLGLLVQVVKVGHGSIFLARFEGIWAFDGARKNVTSRRERITVQFSSRQDGVARITFSERLPLLLRFEGDLTRDWFRRYRMQPRVQLAFWILENAGLSNLFW